MRPDASLFILFICVLGGSWALSPSDYNTSTWMAEMKPIIYSRSLLDITLPGTHDSGAYFFQDLVSPIESSLLADVIKLADLFGIDLYGFIKNWSQTQDSTIYDQLVGGIRYLDLRACYLASLGDWYTEHFLVGTKTVDLLSDFQRFMKESPGEIVVAELGNLDPTVDEPTLIALLQQYLGPWLAPRMDLNQTTIGEMVAKNQRIIMLYPQSNYTQNFTFLWDKTVYMEGCYADNNQLDKMEEWNTQQISTLGGHGKIFELSWTLTTQDSDIIETLLDKDLRENLKTFALDADSHLDSFATAFNNYMLGNILLLDWWEHSNVVPIVLERNLRQCYDDPAYIAVVPSGQYCRNYYTNGNCTNTKYTDWMSVHCRLSCGYC